MERRWLKVASSDWDNSKDALLGTWQAYAAANDRKDEWEASTHLEACLRSMAMGRGPFRDILLTEAGIFQAWFRRDASKAAVWFGRARNGKRMAPLLRTPAEVARHFVEGNFDLAYREWEKGLAVIERFQDAVQRERIRESWLEWKKEMEDRVISNTQELV